MLNPTEGDEGRYRAAKRSAAPPAASVSFCTAGKITLSLRSNLRRALLRF